MEALNQLNQLITTIGLAAAFGGGAAYALFRFLGKSWLESKFKKQLSRFNHEQAKEVARLKVEIDALLDAKITSQKKNFEALTEVWLSLATFHNTVSNLVYKKLVLKSLQNLDDESLKNFCLVNLQFSEHQYETVKKSPNRNNRAVILDDSNRIEIASQAHRECNICVEKYSIFISPEIASSSRNLSIKLGEVLREYVQCHTRPEKDSVKIKLREDLKNVNMLRSKLLDEIQSKITN